jgi:uncharacterized phage infection (PIP) family protein YhgE
MATFYNKTALNKIKKADLIELFLEQQGGKNQLVLDSKENEKLKSHMIYMGHNKIKADLKKLKEENKKLKEQLQSAPEEGSWVTCDYQESREKKLQEQNKKLKQLNDYAYKQMNELMSKVTLLTDEIEKLKEESDSELDEECDQCVCCEVEFDQHEARYNMGEDLRLKYQKYFGSEKDDGDICPECLNRISD